MTNKTANELNNLLDLLSPAVPGSFNTAQKEPLTLHRRGLWFKSSIAHHVSSLHNEQLPLREAGSCFLITSPPYLVSLTLGGALLQMTTMKSGMSIRLIQALGKIPDDKNQISFSQICRVLYYP